MPWYILFGRKRATCQHHLLPSPCFAAHVWRTENKARLPKTKCKNSGASKTTELCLREFAKYYQWPLVGSCGLRDSRGLRNPEHGGSSQENHLENCPQETVFGRLWKDGKKQEAMNDERPRQGQSSREVRTWPSEWAVLESARRTGDLEPSQDSPVPSGDPEYEWQGPAGGPGSPGLGWERNHWVSIAARDR